MLDDDEDIRPRHSIPKKSTTTSPTTTDPPSKNYSNPTLHRITSHDFDDDQDLHNIGNNNNKKKKQQKYKMMGGKQ